MRHLSNALVAAAFLLCGTTYGAAPNVGNFTPRGIQRGHEVELTITGSGLDTAKELMFYDAGVEVTKLEPVNATTLKATVKTGANSPAGSYRFRVRNASGLSEVRVLRVGVLPIVLEKEPNSDFKAPQAIDMNVTVEGTIGNEDVDHFLVKAKKGERITVEVEAIRLATTLFDPFIAIMNLQRFELDSSDDNSLVWQDGIASIVAPEDGDYIVLLRESSFGAGANYRLHIGNFPRPVASFPCGGKPGESLKVRFLGDVAGAFEQQVTLPTNGSDRAAIIAHDGKFAAPSPNWFRVSPLDNVLEAGPSDTPETATRFNAPAALNGVLSKPGEMDRFRFTGKKGDVWEIKVYARAVRSPVDSILSVHTLTGQQLASNDDAGGPDSALRFTVPSDGDFIVAIKDHLGAGGDAYAYRIEVGTVKPTIRMSVGEFQLYVQPTVSIPVGNRTAIFLSASRIDCTGPLTISASDLPPGVTMEAPAIPAGQNIIPVVFHAAPAATVSGSLARISATTEDTAKKTMIGGDMVQDVAVVRYNNAPFWVESLPRMAVAVTEEVPFEIEAVTPKVPLVQNGVMQLKVKARRKGDFKGAIKLDFLWFPPGLNGSRTTSIAEGADEAELTLNADKAAAVGDWKLALTGTATVGGGSIMVASPFFDFKVAEPYVGVTFDNSAIEQAGETDVVVKVEHNKPFSGVAQVKLLGLPNKAETQPFDLTVGKEEIVFHVKADAATPIGTHKSLLCEVTVIENGEKITHILGTGTIRVDAPTVKKPVATTPGQPAPAAGTPVKRLSRLEQLRLEQAEKDKAKAAGTPAKP